MQSFRVIEIEKVIAKHKFVNRYRATKRAHLYCKWLCCKWACFKFSFASSHLNYSSEMQSVFLTWIQAHNLSFSIQAGFNYRLHDYFQLVYMIIFNSFTWHENFRSVFFKPWGNFSSVYRDVIFAYVKGFWKNFL